MAEDAKETKTKGQRPGVEGENAAAPEGEIKVTSGSAEQGPGKLNPSAPGETGTTTKQGVVSKE